MRQNDRLSRTVRAAVLLAVALVLPFVTGQIPQIGKALCPMHLPVLLCGFFCGPQYGLLVGLVAPLLRFALFGMPTIVPTGVIMSMELAAYGLVSGLCWRLLPRRRASAYLSLILAMIAGRVIWGVMHVIFFLLGESEFGWMAFAAGAFLNAIPGIVLQLVVIPLLVMKFGQQFETGKRERST